MFQKTVQLHDAEVGCVLATHSIQNQLELPTILNSNEGL